ncbi:MAG TPA: alpha/beta hydrolase [Solirubrobacteraceae bacterium]|nr:alpha/beta hydrolase [Solirubrobacteraceae bacterium]
MSLRTGTGLIRRIEFQPEDTSMYTATSADGTRIAYDRHGDGPALILVNGALSYRKFKGFQKIAEALSEHCTVVNYDRRGRGDSGEAGPVSVEHEIQDIAALIDAVGGSASLFGFSSGAALALRAAAAGVAVDRLIAYEAPFKTDREAKAPADDYGSRLYQLVDAGDTAGAAKHFMRSAVGLPAPAVAVMSLLPMFKRFAANGLTLPFDYEALGDHNMHGAPLDPDEWATVTCPTLVAYGSKTAPVLKQASIDLVGVLPNATLREVPGENHGLKAPASVSLVQGFVVSPPAPVTA